MQMSWFQVLETSCISAGLSGFAILGARWLGPLAILPGALVGAIIGWVMVNLPLVLWARWNAESLYSRSTEELQDLFMKNPGFGRVCVYQVALMVLMERGVDPRLVLPAILDSMGSENARRRLEAYRAFLTGFPELVGDIQDYRPDDPVEVCRDTVSRVRSARVGRDPESEISST